MSGAIAAIIAIAFIGSVAGLGVLNINPSSNSSQNLASSSYSSVVNQGSSASTAIQPVIQVQTVTVNNSGIIHTYYVPSQNTSTEVAPSSSASSSSPTTQSQSQATSSQAVSSSQQQSSSQMQSSTENTSSSSASPPPISSGGSGSEGVLAISLTDPPTVPVGVTAVTISYSQFQIHISGAGNESGWKNVTSASGSIDLMSVLDASQVIVVAKVTTGVFNALRFNITSVSVTYDGNNYNAFILAGHNLLTIPIDGGIKVTNATATTALVDLSPTVVMLSGQSGPAFLFTPVAIGYVEPTPGNGASSPTPNVGDRVNLTSLSWWQKILAERAKFVITGLALQPSALTIQATNSGNVSVIFSIAALSSQFSVNGGDAELIADSQMFVVEPNATLVAINGAPANAQVVSTILAGGYLLPPGKSVTFTYTGPIVIGGLGRNAHGTYVVAGQTYLVSLEGNGLFARGATVAQSGTTITTTSTTISTTTKTTTTHSTSSHSSTTKTPPPQPVTVTKTVTATVSESTTTTSLSKTSTASTSSTPSTTTSQSSTTSTSSTPPTTSTSSSTSASSSTSSTSASSSSTTSQSSTSTSSSSA